LCASQWIAVPCSALSRSWRLRLHRQAQADYRYADAHVHLVDFFQEGDGASALLAALDTAGIGHIVLMGMPVTKL
jgi:hypothetical protein